MARDALLSRYRTASRRALFASVLVLAGVACALLWNARRLDAMEAKLENVESVLKKKTAELEGLREEKQRLSETLRSLRDAPDGGVRALAEPVKVTGQVHDFTVWIDTAKLSKKVARVTYQFAASGYETLSSTLAANGFAAYFRGPVRPAQPVCPGRTKVTIVFEDASTTVVHYDLCAELDL